MVKKREKKATLKKAVKAKQSAKTKRKNSGVTAGLAPPFQSVFIKVCRLCETKDGPFLNIFEADKLTAKRIDAVMPFRITEYDELPHKICFRCSAKVEELYEFIQKCIKTQDRLQNAIGRKLPCTKVKHRELWEEKLNQSNISNDDICDALIKRAMEGIKDIPLNSKPLQEFDSPFIKTNSTMLQSGNNNDKNNGDFKRSTKDTAKKIESYNKCLGLDNEDNIKKEEVTSREATQEYSDDESPITPPLRSSNETKTNETEKIVKPKEANKTDKKGKNTRNMEVEAQKNNEKEVPQTNTFSLNDATPIPEPTFNIMEHVSMIKVNGVGVLFQCKLCNRNFLKKQVVMAHACSRNGSAKVLRSEPIIVPELPKISTVKYINTKTIKSKKAEEENKTSDKVELDNDKPVEIKKPRPRVGPASKVRRYNDDASSNDTPAPVEAPHTDAPPEIAPVVQIPKYPSLNSRYKLTAGPNNTFTLIEEKVASSPEEQPVAENPKITILKPKDVAKSITENRPYPVKLFKTSAHNSDSEPTFTTPAMKKQSYTVVQTGNPSKLLISSKPQPEEIPKKRLRRNRNDDKLDDSQEQPFSVTLEDITPAKDDGFFTFVNVDPLLQPSYVLPTDNIIQESQISTSTNITKQNIIKDSDLKYSCNLCNEVFSREKKLLTHITSHYNKIDEEDQIRAEKPGRKRRK